MKEVAVVVFVVACGGKQPAPSTSNVSPTEGAVPAPVLPAEWESLTPGTYEVDLDGDGTPEAITVEGSEHDKTISIDGTPYECATENVSTFGSIGVLDLEPTLPGLELHVSGHLTDDDFSECFVTKVGGKLASLATYNNQVEGNQIQVLGTCSQAPTVYTRVATGFEEHPELVPAGLETRCCDGPDCP